MGELKTGARAPPATTATAVRETTSNAGLLTGILGALCAICAEHLALQLLVVSADTMPVLDPALLEARVV